LICEKDGCEKPAKPGKSYCHHTHDPVVRAKISAAKLAHGDNHPSKRPEVRAKISANNKSHRPEVRAKLSRNAAARRPEVRAKISATKQAQVKAGTHSSQQAETRARISAGLRALGENHPCKRPEVREKLRLARSRVGNSCRQSNPERLLAEALDPSFELWVRLKPFRVYPLALILFIGKQSSLSK